MISTANLTIQFGPEPLFENVSAKFEEGGHYGLIGANGCGKSTFMKILASRLAATSGSVIVTPGQRIGVLGQDQFAFEEYRTLDAVMMGHAELWEILQERNRIYSQAEMSEEDGMKAAELESRFAELDGYTAESRAGELLMGVGIPLELHQQPMSAVAPGLKLRVLLTQVLFSNPDIMLLDEPTNNLDIDTIRWLESVLRECKSTMIIISHDRHFLNSVCTHMADLDYRELRLYPGNYDDYMTASTMAREKMLTDNARKQAKISELQAFVSRFSANASKARQATSRARQIEKIQLAEVKVSSRKSPYIRFDQGKKLFRMALEVKKLANGYGEDLLFSGVNLDIEVGQRVAVIGPNGIGKTTLLRTLMGELPWKKGSVKWSDNSTIGYFAQHHEADFEEDLNLYDWMSQWRSASDDEQVIRGILGRLLFSGDDIKKKVSVLSGGEQGRMLFGKLMLLRPNILVMDEPTNHLDMESIESLNLALENYEGTIIFVTHDREFVSSIANRIVELTPQGVHDYRGNYEEYLISQGKTN